jgi:acetylornithine aminotransferase
VLAFNTLSKRSAMPGYRSGLAAGDPELISALKRYRPNIGVAIPDFVQRASIAAWGDEEHVAGMREIYRSRRDAMLPTFEALGLRHAGGDATFFLWLDAGPRAEELATEWLDKGIVVAPGSFFGPAGEGFLRLSLVPPLEACQRAAAMI